MARVVLVVLALVGAPGAASAQSLGIGARVGTAGLGGELAVDLSDRLVVRGGVGMSVLDPRATFDGVEVTLGLPTWYHAGLDLYLNGAMRLGAGVLFKSEDLVLSGELDSSVDLGGVTFSAAQVGTLSGVFDSRNQAPYLLLGFGRHTAPGVGLYLDLGVAFFGDPVVRLDAQGGTLSGDTEPLASALDREARSFEQDMRAFMRFWPFVSLGLRVGLE